jgi:hypothetical protein
LKRAGHTQKELHEYMLSLDFNLYAWDDTSHTWRNDAASLVSIGNVWAARSKDLLPSL